MSQDFKCLQNQPNLNEQHRLVHNALIHAIMDLTPCSVDNESTHRPDTIVHHHWQLLISTESLIADNTCVAPAPIEHTHGF